MSSPSTPDEAPRLAIPVGPSVEVWRAMSPAARAAFLDEVNAALSERRGATRERRGLDLLVPESTLELAQCLSDLFGTDNLMGRLNGMVNSLEAKADAEATRAQQAATRAAQATTRAAQATTRAEQAATRAAQATTCAAQATTRAAQATTRAEQASARAEQASARAEQEATRARVAVVGLRAGVLAAFDVRGVLCSDELRGRVERCDDPATLQRWLLRALTAATADEAVD